MEQDKGLAIDCWGRAAACRFAPAYQRLGWAYLRGEGVAAGMLQSCSFGYVCRVYTYDMYCVLIVYIGYTTKCAL